MRERERRAKARKGDVDGDRDREKWASEAACFVLVYRRKAASDVTGDEGREASAPFFGRALLLRKRTNGPRARRARANNAAQKGEAGRGRARKDGATRGRLVGRCSIDESPRETSRNYRKRA